MPILLSALTGGRTGEDADDVIRAIAQTQARQVLSTLAALTDSSGGTASPTKTVVDTAVAVGAANSGSNLADKTTTEAALVTALDATRELFAKADAVAVALGLGRVTYSGGGAAPDGAVAAVTVSVTGAATGVPVAAFNTCAQALAEALYNVAAQVNRLLDATGGAKMTVARKGALLGTIAAISTSLGTAASPGTTKVEADAALAGFRANVATIAAAINSLRAGVGVPGVVAVA